MPKLFRVQPLRSCRAPPYKAFYFILSFTTASIFYLCFQCEHYKSRDVNGNLCQALCEADTLLYVKCLNLNKGKIVFLAKCLKPNCNKYHDINIVMKYKNKKHEQNRDHETVSANKTLEYYLDRGFPGFWFTDDGHWSNAGLKQIYRKINKQSHFILGEDDLTNLLTSNDVKSHQLADNLQRHKDEISLLVQDEYVFTKMFAGPVFVPNLYGSCGHFYAVEYTPSKSMIGSKFSKISHWKERARVALAIFHIVDSLDTMFVEPLEFCDIKESNFGTAPGAYGSLKIIDSDMIWFESVLHADLVQCYCTKDEDCDINDCHGSCNLITNQCRPYRKNNNLQVCDIIALEKKER